MALEKIVAKQSSPDRRPAVATLQPVRPRVGADTSSSAQLLRQRLGNQGLQAFVSRTLPASQGTTTTQSKSTDSGVQIAPSMPSQSKLAGASPSGSDKEAAPSLTSKTTVSSSKSATAPAPKKQSSVSSVSIKPGVAVSGKAIVVSETKALVGGLPKKTGATKAVASNPRAAIGPAIAAVQNRAAGARKHSSTGGLVASAQAAAINPQAEQKRAAATQTVANLDAAKAEEVKRNEFKSKLKKAIADATPQPKTEAQAEQVMKSGAAQASGTLRAQLSTERDAAAGPMKAATEAEVPASSQPAPPAASLQSEQVGPSPAPISAAPVVPAPLPPEQLDYSSDRGSTDQMMAENNVTQEQMKEGNDPAFGPALEARSTAEKHEASAEAKYRQSEAKVQNQAQTGAAQALAKDLAGMQGSREQQVGKVVSQQLGTKTQDAQERQRITDTIHGIKDKTKLDVEAILSSMETEAGEKFETGLKSAEDAYNAAFEEAKGGIGTWLTTWGSDWDKHIESALARARSEYLRQVDIAIDNVASFVDGKLKTAKQRVTDGRKEVENYVKGLDASVKQFGEDALQAVSADFDSMTSDIDQRSDALINKLTEQYKASYERMSAMEDQLREENKSLWQRVYDATVGLIKKIIAFKDMLMGILGRAVAVIGDIIAHPIRFLGNLVSGVMQGLKNFMSKIGTYLLKGLMDWLFGALAGAGLQLPDSFDLKGIISIVLQILGLTYANFRARAVTIVGEPVVAAIEKTAEVFKVIITEGVPGLWRFIKEQLADLKSMVMDAIFDFVKEKVIMAGITWIIGLLNPASAFFKACKAIYDIIMFFVNRGSQILALVNAVIDSMASIAKGAIGVAAGLVENALAKAIPVAIGFLAGLLGLGDPSKPVKGFIEKARTPVNKAIDWVINLAVKGVKAVGNLIKGLLGGKDKSKDNGKNDGSARTVAQDAIKARIGAETTFEDAERIIRQIEVELKPIGVKKISIAPEGKDEERPVLVEASPVTRVASLVSKKIMVAVSAKVTVGRGDVIKGILRPPEKTWLGSFGEALDFRESYKSEKQREALGGTGLTSPLPGVSQPIKTPARKGDQPGAGLILEPESGSNQLEILAWNTGNSIGRKDADGEYETNVSHAEHQFVEWFINRPQSWRNRVEIVEVDVEASGSVDKICAKCAADFDRIRKLNPNINLITKFIKKESSNRKNEKLKFKS